MCVVPGCNKSYARSSHLTRHVDNSHSGHISSESNELDASDAERNHFQDVDPKYMKEGFFVKFRQCSPQLYTRATGPIRFAVMLQKKFDML